MPDTITVYGTARRRVSPDIGTWNAVVEARGVDERTAYGACASKLSAVHAAVSAAGHSAEVSATTIWLQAEWSESGQRVVGHLACANVVIRASLTELEPLGQSALDAGAVRLDGPSYEIGEQLAIMDELGAEAVAAARVRASALAAAAGRGVGEVVAIFDGAQQATAPTAGGEMHGMRVAAKMDVGPVSPESRELQADVTVTYLLI